MIVTTGGRSARSSSASSWTGSSGSSSAALTISTFWSSAAARAVTASSERVWVSVAISPSSISFLITSALPRLRLSATSRTVAPEAILVGVRLGRLAQRPDRRLLEQRPAAAPAAAPGRPVRRRLRHVLAARRLGVDHDPAALAPARAGRRSAVARLAANRAPGAGLSAAGFPSALLGRRPRGLRLRASSRPSASAFVGLLSAVARRRRPGPSGHPPPRRSKRPPSPRCRPPSAPRAPPCWSGPPAWRSRGRASSRFLGILGSPRIPRPAGSRIPRRPTV